MRALLTMFCISIFALANAQEIKGNIKNHAKTEMDMVLMLFGMEKPISIGKVDKKGAFTANLTNLKMDNITEEERSMNLGELGYNLFFNCGNVDDFGKNAGKMAARQDYVRLTDKGEWAGTVFLVSDEALIPWIEDSGYNNAILGSFYEVIYLAEDVEVKTSCTSTNYVSDDKEVETFFEYDLKLNAGFNWLQYTILEVYETDPNIRASFPLKVKITNVTDTSKMKWIGTYY
jgi:hypothetical protein